MSVMLKATQTATARNIYDILNKIKTVNSSVILVKGGRNANAKSLLGLMSLSINPGDKFELVTKADENMVASLLKDYFQIIND